MRSILILCVLLLGSALCANAQHLKTKNGHENNPYYSNTDTKPLNVSNAEWKKKQPKNNKLFKVYTPEILETQDHSGFLLQALQSCRER